MIKILFIDDYIHKKNKIALQNYKNIYFDIISIRYGRNEIEDYLHKIDLKKYDCVFSPATPINTSLFPQTNFLFGPHFSVFPDDKINIIKNKNAFYNLLSDWVVNFWKKYEIVNNLNIVKIPFGVDTNKFAPNKEIAQRNNVFVYLKERDPINYKCILNFLSYKNINYTVINYNDKYEESHYLNILKNSKYGIWVGRHESQGFALQEALSCNVPLLVWNVVSMNQAYGYNMLDQFATCIPFWDERCGSVFYEEKELQKTFDSFIEKIETFTPREYILENLSMEVCEKQLIDAIQNFTH
jgi:hypothetical protein